MTKENVSEEAVVEDNVIVRRRLARAIELCPCRRLGHPDKMIYYKFIFSKCTKEIRDEMLKRAEQYLAELKSQK